MKREGRWMGRFFPLSQICLCKSFYQDKETNSLPYERCSAMYFNSNSYLTYLMFVPIDEIGLCIRNFGRNVYQILLKFDKFTTKNLIFY